MELTLDGNQPDYAPTHRKPTKRRWPKVVAVLVIVLLLALACCLAIGYVNQPKGDTGSYLIPQGDMTDEQAREMLDAQAEASRITVSLRPEPELVDGQLHVNFVVVPGNNEFAERLEVEQDGAIVYRSGIVQPQHVIEWGSAPTAHAGLAVATVYAVDGSGNDFGNPVSVEIEIVEG